MDIPLPQPFEVMALLPAVKTWCIVIQQRSAYNGRFASDDFRAYRKWFVWPKLFQSEAECRAFMEKCFTFKNLRGSKMSASAMSVSTLRRLNNPSARKRTLRWEDFR